MARMIKHEATSPFEIKPAPQSTWVCMCGLSANYPLCDGSHKQARQQEQPGKLYRYQDGKAIELPNQS